MRLVADDLQRFVVSRGLARGAVGGQRAVHVGDADHLRLQLDLLPLEAAGVAAAEVPLVVVAHRVQHQLVVLAVAAQEEVPLEGMTLDLSTEGELQ